jgi:hypothetical protein
MTDKRKNNGGHTNGGRKSLGERVSVNVRIPLHCSEWLSKQTNKNAAIVALIEKEIKQSID